MRTQHQQALNRQSELAERMASDFEATLLHNTVRQAVADDDQLAALLDVTARTRDAKARREADLGSDAERLDELDEAAGKLSHIARTRAREVVSGACAAVVEDADQWVADGITSEATAETAVAEAEDWLRANTNVSDRLGHLGVVAEGSRCGGVDA